jgi:hypothetical protein
VRQHWPRQASTSKVVGADVPLPRPDSLYRYIAATVGSADWGAVTTTVPEDDQPRVLPLRQAYELRPHVLRIERAGGAQLACEVLFGMAKMTPMTDAALGAGAE